MVLSNLASVFYIFPVSLVLVDVCELPVPCHGLVGGEHPVAVGALLGAVVAVHAHVLLQVARRVRLPADVAHGCLHVRRAGVVQAVNLHGGCSVLMLSKYKTNCLILTFDLFLHET